jgi:formamidopyrimidine-DNA glycosylase
MPELPEVETVRIGLEALLTGRIIKSVQCYRAALRYPLPDLNALSGMRVAAVRRRAKYLIFDLEQELALVWHLGMSGQFHVLSQSLQAGRHEHVRFDLSDGMSLRYRDPRRFGYAGLLPGDGIERHRWFVNLGPEPLGADFNGEHLFAVCRNRKAPIKSVIMDAAAVVGVGNIYASESLFRAGIHPARAAGRISRRRLQALADMIKQVLTEAIEAGGSSISDFIHVDGKPGYFAHAFRVYGREGKPCLCCRKEIRRLTQSGRSTFYCSGCQH